MQQDRAVAPVVEACMSAVILRAFMGSTRVSPFPVKNMMAGYFVRGLTCW